MVGDRDKDKDLAFYLYSLSDLFVNMPVQDKSSKRKEINASSMSTSHMHNVLGKEVCKCSVPLFFLIQVKP